MISIEDERGYIHVFNTDYIKSVEFTKGKLVIIMKDARTDDVIIKAKKITFS